MRVAVVFFGGNDRDRFAEIARGVAAGIGKAGHHVDVIDGHTAGTTKLTGYEYIALGAPGVSFFGGKIPPQVREFLSQAGIVGGKKCFAFTSHRLFGAGKVLKTLMGVMEHEGMFIRYSEILRSRSEAELVGTRLKLDH
ncbi:MAG: flavodoxin family protein [Alkalispirochaeta sp.]